MTKKKIEHVGIRNSNLFCSNCGREQIIPYPIEPDMFAAMGKAFEKSHTDCAKTWQEPTAPPSLSEVQKAAFWWKNGERGLSSETIFNQLSGRGASKNSYHPCDPDDFRRCYLLLKAIPEWKDRLVLLKSISQSWSNLVHHWDELTAMLEEMLAGKKSSKMYDLMQTLIR